MKKQSYRVNLIPPQAILSKIPKIGETEKIKDPTVWVKYFHPYGAGTWLVTEFDGHDEMFGLAMITDAELGYFSLRELQSVKGPMGVPGIERDLHFTPKPLSQARRENHMASILNEIDKLACACEDKEAAGETTRDTFYRPEIFKTSCACDDLQAEITSDPTIAELESMMEKIASRPLNEIAQEIYADKMNWSGKQINYAAKPYLEAMASLRDISDNYYEDSGSSVVAYFLANAQQWRGEKAKAIKKELNAMLKANRSASVMAELDDVMSKFEEGKPADPTENMSEEDKKKWEKYDGKVEKLADFGKFSIPKRIHLEQFKQEANKIWEPEVADYLNSMLLKLVSKFLRQGNSSIKNKGLDYVLARTLPREDDVLHFYVMQGNMTNYLAEIIPTDKMDEVYKKLYGWTAKSANITAEIDALVAGKNPTNTPDKHQLKILKDTVINPNKGKFLGGPSAEEAEKTLREKFDFTDKEINALKKSANLMTELKDDLDREADYDPGKVLYDDPENDPSEGSLVPGMEPRRSSELDEKESRFEEGKPADPTENMSEEDAAEWKKQKEENKDNFKAARDRMTWDKTGKSPTPVEVFARDRLTNTDKTAAKAPSGLYGFTRGIQSACEGCIGRLNKYALKLAKSAFSEDEQVAPFLVSHAKRAGSLPAKVLIAAMQNIGPQIPKEPETSKEAAMSRDHGLYGYKAKTAARGLAACQALRIEAGHIATDLHKRRADHHGKITTFLKTHAKEAKDIHAQMLYEGYPETTMKFASPNTVEEWLTWED